MSLSYFFIPTFSFTFMVDLIKALCFDVVVTSHLGWKKRKHKKENDEEKTFLPTFFVEAFKA